MPPLLSGATRRRPRKRGVDEAKAELTEGWHAEYRAAVMALGDYVNKNRFPGVVLGMSGGIDSALTAAIAVDALGPERVWCVMMPSKYTSSDSLEDAKLCAEALGARTEVRPVLDGIARLMNRLYDSKGIDVTVTGTETAVFRGEQQDLEEMVGNLMENACKWASSEVLVRVRDTAAALTIDVEDNGKGLSPEEREGALKRGVRLDETTPGTGLGLSIVKELAELHRGSLELGDAELGGLKAQLRFPKP